MGVVTGQANWRPVLGVLASWVITLPCAALFSALAYLVIRHWVMP
jgi:phosphate/sulfate permease